MSGPSGWTLEAPAKVNLFLRVGARRPDGYHELHTLFQSLELADSVRMTVDPSGPARVGLTVLGAELGAPEDNLAVRAARAFGEAFGLPGEVHVELEKRIPAGAGLGGGSSDAAAVLKVLAGVRGGQASPIDPEGLLAVAAGLGSDVPFFLQPTSLAEGRGRGELLTALAPLPVRPVVLALPRVHVSTPRAYGALAAARVDAGGTTDARPEGARFDPGAAGGPRWSEVEAAMENDFEQVVPPEHTEIRASLDALHAEGARVALLSGSGAASFGLFDTSADATAVAQRLTDRLGWPFVATRTRTTMPVPAGG